MLQFTGKLKHMKTKSEKSSSKEEQQDEKPGTVDQIKKKYGFSKSGNVSTKQSCMLYKHNMLPFHFSVGTD